jgi:predicted nuclease of predicted toxin-antitoxin system
MRFLLDANLPRAVSRLLDQFHHEGIDFREIGLAGASDREVPAYAQAQGLTPITRDFDFSDIRNYPPQEFCGIIVLDLPDDATATTVSRLLNRSFQSRHCFPKCRVGWQFSN